MKCRQTTIRERPKATNRRELAVPLAEAQLAWLEAGEDRTLMRDRSHQIDQRQWRGSRAITTRERDCLRRLHGFDKKWKRQKMWTGDYVRWASKTADARFIACYGDLLRLHLDSRFPDTRKGMKQFIQFIDSLDEGTAIKHFPLPKDRSNPIDAVSWEIGFLAGMKTEALHHRFGAPDRTNTQNRKTQEIREHAFRAAVAWRMNHPSLSGPMCKEIMDQMGQMKVVLYEPQSKLKWFNGSDDREMSESQFRRLWGKFKRAPDFIAALKILE